MTIRDTDPHTSDEERFNGEKLLYEEQEELAQFKQKGIRWLIAIAITVILICLVGRAPAQTYAKHDKVWETYSAPHNNVKIGVIGQGNYVILNIPGTAKTTFIHKKDLPGLSQTFTRDTIRIVLDPKQSNDYIQLLQLNAQLVDQVEAAKLKDISEQAELSQLKIQNAQYVHALMAYQRMIEKDTMVWMKMDKALFKKKP